MAVESKHICTKSGHEFRSRIVRPGNIDTRTYQDEHGNDLATAHVRCKLSGVGIVTTYSRSDVSVHIKDWAKPNEPPLIQICGEPVLISGNQYIELVARKTARRLRALHISETEMPSRVKISAIGARTKDLITTPRDRRVASTRLSGVISLR